MRALDLKQQLGILLVTMTVALGVHIRYLSVFGDDLNAVYLIPAALGGWMLGARRGALCGAATFLSVLAAHYFARESARFWHMGDLPGLMAVLVVSVAAGWVSDLVADRDRQAWALAREVVERVRSEDRLRLIFSQLPGMAWTTDRDLRITSLSRYPGLDGKLIDQVFERPEEVALLMAGHQAALAGRPGTYEFMFRSRTLQCRVKPLLDDRGQIMGTIGVAMDITERKALEEELRRLASEDGLSGVANRRGFLAELIQRVEGGSDPRGALLFLDVDGFKQVNDTYGHRVGDRLVGHIAGVLQRSVRSQDLVARFGGDEFAVWLAGVSSAEAEATAARMRCALQESSFAVRGGSLHLKASIGVGLYPEHGRTVEDLLARADQAMYSEKEMGRDRPAAHVGT